MKRPWMPFYVGDYLASTGHLTTEQHGAYLLLIMHYWVNGRLPNSDRELMAIARMSDSKWYSNRMAIASFFTTNWQHKRIEAELEKVKKISEARSLSGLKGAWKRHGGPTENVWQMPTHSHSHRYKRDDR